MIDEVPQMGAPAPREYEKMVAKKSEPKLVDSPDYHLAEIPKGHYGYPSKIFEEVAEFEDALDQGNTLMALMELSDLYGAIKGYLEKNFPKLSMDDLRIMSNTTERAFKSGQRK